MLSLQLIAKARAQGWLLTPRQVFEQPSVARLAAVMRPLEADAEQAEIHEPLPLTPIQSWFHARYPQGEAHWNQSVLLRVRGELDLPAFERALGAVIARHDALRLGFERDADGLWQQRVLAEAAPTQVQSIDLRAAGERWADALEQAGEDAQRSLDPRVGRLVKAVAFRTPELADGSAEGRLLLVIHHLAVDGVSWRILLADLAAAYEAAVAGRAIALDAALSWSVWAAAQREAATPARIATALPAWQAALADAVAPIEAPAGTAATSDVIDWKFERDDTEALRRAARLPARHRRAAAGRAVARGGGPFRRRRAGRTRRPWPRSVPASGRPGARGSRPEPHGRLVHHAFPGLAAGARRRRADADRRQGAVARAARRRRLLGLAAQLRRCRRA
ncbi:MAG: condensation domain-containing protein [Burkholderia sp.]